MTSRKFLERKHNIGEIVNIPGVDPNQPNYRIPNKISLDYIGNPCCEIPMPSFETININTYKLQDLHSTYIDILTIRKDDLGNVLSKKWERITNNIEDNQMKFHKGDIVVYLKNRDLSQLGDNNKAIWVIETIFDNRVVLRSIVKYGESFPTYTNNIITVDELINKNMFKREFFKDDAFHNYLTRPLNTETKITEDKSMNYKNNENNMVKRATDANIDAVKVAAAIATGRTVNSVMINKFKDQLPMLVRGYADTPLGAVVIANLVDFAVKQLAADNVKFNYVSNAMMQAAMVDLLGEFDFEGIMNDVLSGVTLGDISED